MGTAFSIADILGTLYFGNILKYKADNPEWEERDKVILSKGHAGVALYATLALAGYFDKEYLKTFSNIRGEISSSKPIREGIPLKYQMWETGAANSICPIRSRRTLARVTSTPQRSQILPL